MDRMNAGLIFYKVVGAGNDFVLIDARRTNHAKLGPWSHWAQSLCHRPHGVGADGLLVVLPDEGADARMRIFNADGSEAEMCGNGLRCVAWYLFTCNRKRSFRIKTQAGTMPAQIVGLERVRIEWPSPQRIRLGLRITHRKRSYTLHAIDTGVPHAVVFVQRLEAVDPLQMGPVIRYHRLFRPRGTNVNWVKIHSPHRIALRTYERGVEAETLACGTGAVASAILGTALGRLKPPIQVHTAGGDVLTVCFRQTRHLWEGLTLEGPARILFQGRLESFLRKSTHWVVSHGKVA
jgi:diaminopimelate epimerase